MNLIAPVRLSAASISLVTSLALLSNAEAQITFTHLGFSSPFDISDNGSVVVGGNGPGVYRWTQATGKVVPADLAAIYDTNVYVSGDGKVIAGHGTTFTGTDTPYRWGRVEWQDATQRFASAYEKLFRRRWNIGRWIGGRRHFAFWTGNGRRCVGLLQQARCPSEHWEWKAEGMRSPRMGPRLPDTVLC